MKIQKKIQVARPYIDNNDIKGVVSVLKSGFLSLGPKYIEFENKIARYAKAEYACAVANGTTGLHLCVRALGIKEGDEVITSPFSFISSSNCLLYERVKPVFVPRVERDCAIIIGDINNAVHVRHWSRRSLVKKDGIW